LLLLFWLSQNEHFGLGVVNIVDHKVESANKKSIAVITGNYECVGADSQLHTGINSYASVSV